MANIMIRHKSIKKTVISIITILIIAFSVFPILYVATTAFKPRLYAFTTPPVLFIKPTVENFILVFTKQGFWENFLNSLIISLSSTLMAICIGVPAAYAFSRFNFKRKKDLSFFILSTRMAPPIAAVIPFYMIVRNIGFYDKQISLILIYLAFNLSLTIWLMESFFNGIPKDLEESAQIDGCSRFSGFLRIILPLSLPGLATTAIFCFLFSWNEFLMAMILTGRLSKTLPVLMTGYLQQTSGILWGEMSAASLVIMIPTIVFTLLVQRYLIRGLTFGAVKG